MWEAIIGALGSLAGGAFSAAGSQAASSAQTKAAKDQLALYQGQYNDTRNLLKPQYLQSGDAMNMLASQFGIAPQNYAAAFGAGSSGQNDQWDAYLKNNSDVAAEWSKLQTQTKNPFSSAQEYAQYHYNTFGKNEGRQLPTMDYGAASTGATGGTASAQNPLAAFWASPYGELATKGFLGVDTPEVQGAYATGGKALSGAATKALYDRGQARAQNAYGTYTNRLANLAGMGTGASLAGAAQNYGSNAASVLGANGNNQAESIAAQYSGWGNGINGAINNLSKINWGSGGYSGSSQDGYWGGGQGQSGKTSGGGLSKFRGTY